MSYIKGFDRNQAVLIPETIEQLIDTNHSVRFIDALVNFLHLSDFGFRDSSVNKS